MCRQLPREGKGEGRGLGQSPVTASGASPVIASGAECKASSLDRALETVQSRLSIRPSVVISISPYSYLFGFSFRNGNGIFKLNFAENPPEVAVHAAFKGNLEFRLLLSGVTFTVRLTQVVTILQFRFLLTTSPRRNNPNPNDSSLFPVACPPHSPRPAPPYM